MDRLRNLLNTDKDPADMDPLDELNFKRARAQVTDIPDVGDIPVKEATQDDGTDGQAVEIKHGKAASEEQMAWYNVVFNTPFAAGTEPTVVASVESRSTQESDNTYEPPTHDSPGITGFELVDISIEAPTLSERSLSQRSLEDVSLQEVTLSDKQLSDVSLARRDLAARELEQASLDTQVNVGSVNIPGIDIPSASISDVSIGSQSLSERQLDKIDFAAPIDVSEIGSVGGAIEPTQSIEEQIQGVPEEFSIPLDDFGDDLDIRQQIAEVVDEIERQTFESAFKERNRNAGRQLVNVGGDFINNTIPGLGVNLDGELVDVLSFIATELYGAPGDPSQGEGVVESIWGAIGAVLDDAVAAGFIQRGNEIEDLKQIVSNKLINYDDQITSAINSLINEIVTDVKSVGEAVNNDINNLAGITDSELNNIGGLADNKIENFRGNLNDRINTLKSEIQNSLSDINTIQDNVENEFKNLNAEINDILSAMSSDINSIFSTLVANIEEQFNARGDEIQSQLNSQGRSIQDQVNSLRDDIESTIVNNNAVTRDSIIRLNENVLAELEDMNANIESVLADIVDDAEVNINGLRADVLDEMQRTVDEVNQQSLGIETELQGMNTNIEETLQNIVSDAETTIQEMNQEIDEQIQLLSDDTQSGLITLRDNTEEELNNLSDDVESQLNSYNQNVLSSYETITSLAEESLNRSREQMYAEIGAPDGEAITPVHIRNISETGFQFLGYEGGMKIHWTAIGASTEGSDIIGGGGGEDIPGLPVLIGR